jgi:hypothetical protein
VRVTTDHPNEKPAPQTEGSETDSNERIRWARRVSQAKIWQLYQNDARGLVDEALIDEVGIALYARAQSILLVTNAKVRCPRCRSVFHVGWEHEDDDAIACPADGCTWETTYYQYRRSWHRQHLFGGNANPELEQFIRDYRRARRPQERMILIDQLIHAFHRKLKASDPTKSAAPNLIEGKGPRVVAFLDRLTYGDAGTPELEETKAAWREKLEAEHAK